MLFRLYKYSVTTDRKKYRSIERKKKHPEITVVHILINLLGEGICIHLLDSGSVVHGPPSAPVKVFRCKNIMVIF